MDQDKWTRDHINNCVWRNVFRHKHKIRSEHKDLRPIIPDGSKAVNLWLAYSLHMLIQVLNQNIMS